MNDTLTPEQIAAFQAMHGAFALDRCVVAERRARLARRSLGSDGAVTPGMLERQGLPGLMARDYCELLYPPPAEVPRVRGTIRRKAER